MVWRYGISFLLFFSPHLAARTYLDFPKTGAEIGKSKIENLYVAITDEDRQLGLMHVFELPSSHGVLFVFEEEKLLSFWMKNTFVPLSIGFFDAQGCLLEFLDMEPVKSLVQARLPQYRSSRPAKYALEVEKGWFLRKKITVGTGLRLTNPSSITKSRDLDPLHSPKCSSVKDLKAN